MNPKTRVATDQQLVGLSTLLQLEEEARRAASVRELHFFAVNESHRLLSYHQAVMWCRPILIVQTSNGESSIIQENIIHSFKSEAGAVTWISPKTPFQLINNSHSTINYNIIELREK